MKDEHGRTALYRLYCAGDEDDDCGTTRHVLYIGITSDPERRFAEHAADKDWWPKVAHHDVEWYWTRHAAEAAEEAAIRAHAPIYNVTHSPAPRVKVTVELDAEVARALDLLCRVVSRETATIPSLARDEVAYSLIRREVEARGLLGDPPCYQGLIAWPDAMGIPVCASRALGRCRKDECEAGEHVIIPFEDEAGDDGDEKVA